MSDAIHDEIQAYWEDPNTRSLIDNNLRRLEEGVVLKYVEPGHELLDIGCGDGVSTLTYAKQVKRCLGLERSNYLRGRAEESLAAAAAENVCFVAGDIMDLDAYRGQFDVAVTQRVLINLASWEEQRQAIENVRATLRPGGLYVMIENTYEGHDAMNAWRASLGLKKVSRHWHNFYFHHDQLVEHLQSRFRLVAHHPFDLYYFLTRVYANLFASFEGFGKQAVKDGLFDQIDAAARRLYEQHGGEVRVGAGPAFGPIQGFVLRKMDDR